MEVKKWNINFDNYGKIIQCSKKVKNEYAISISTRSIIVYKDKKNYKWNQIVRIEIPNKYANLADRFAKALTSEEESEKKFLTFIIKLVILVL